MLKNSEEKQQSLVNFMKKHASEKTSKHKDDKKSSFSSFAKNAKKDGKKDSDEEEMSDEEKLEAAKKESKGKAANYDQSEMIKRMILEAGVKYAVIIGLLVCAALALINLMPFIGSVIHGLLSGILSNAIPKH